jgi:hypothetical protein
MKKKSKNNNLYRTCASATLLVRIVFLGFGCFWFLLWAFGLQLEAVFSCSLGLEACSCICL